jgi:outer membrane protein OmpA-like peptidoglycan-associated protein
MRRFQLALLLLACGAGASQAQAQAARGPVDCFFGPFIIFFARGKAEIVPDARAILDNAVDTFRGCGGLRHIIVDGHADRSGSAAHNVAVSRRRAAVAAAYLVRHGIPPGAITIRALGESRPLVKTVDGVAEAQNRRVEISPAEDPANF